MSAAILVHSNPVARQLRKRLTATFALLLVATILHGGEADVVGVEIQDLGDNRYRIDVTLKHDDEGWDHYADRWDVISGADGSGDLLGSRVLAHPHVNEQPFTRSLSVSIPAGVTEITIQANDSVHETGGITMTAAVPGR